MRTTTEISPEALREVQSALERYEQALNASPLQPNSSSTKLACARQFVAWLEGQYEPGQGLLR